MPLAVPNLDDRHFEDLVEEARRLIPIYHPEWTNHNPSDPGIALVELFAHLTEMLLYRLDRVTLENQRKFLKLLAGPDWTPGSDMTSDIRTVVRSVRTRERAVTAADFERLTLEDFNDSLVKFQRAQSIKQPLDEWWQVSHLDPADPANLPSNLPSVARVSCSPSRNLDRGTEATRLTPAPGHVSLTVLSCDGAPQPPDNLKAVLSGYLDQWQTLTTRLHVVGPRYAPIKAEIVVAADSHASAAVVAACAGKVGDRVKSFLHALTGGDGQGWPFGRPVYASELYDQIEAVEGVDYVTDIMLVSECRAGEARCAGAAPIWHREGDFVGVAIEQPNLPRARDEQSVVVARSTSFVPVRVRVELVPERTGNDAVLKRRVKMAVRAFLHPLYGGPGPSTQTHTTLDVVALERALIAVPGVGAVSVLEVKADPDRPLARDGQIVLAPGELVDWETQVIILGE